MTKRVQSLEALRGIGFLLIFCSHCVFINIFSASWGTIGVSIFVVLSGFVVTLGSDMTGVRSDLKAVPYFLKRIYKIFPLHIIMLCIRLLFDYSLGIETSLPVILLNITMLKSFIPIREIYYSLGGVTWYLTLIWFFALLTPFLLKTLNKINMRKYWTRVFVVILLFRVLWIYIWHGSDTSQWWNYINPFFRVTDFFLGMMLGANINSIRKVIESKKRIYFSLAFFVWSVFIVYLAALSTVILPWYHVYLRTFISVGLIILFTYSNDINKTKKTGIYENKFLIYIGRVSFELFLIHIHVRNIVNYIFKQLGIDNSIVLLITVFIISIAIAQLYSYVHALVKRNRNIKGKN